MNIALESLDLFKNSNFFFFKSRRQIFSIQGVFISLFIYAILIMLFFQSDAILKKNPTISDEILANSEGIIPVNNLNVIPILNMYDSNYNYVTEIDTSYFNIGVYLNDLQYFLHPCNSNDMINENVQESYYESSFCIDKNLTLELISTKDIVTILHIKIFMCNNETYDGNCKPQSEINDFLGNKMIYLNFIQSSFDLNNFSSPVIIDTISGYVRSFINLDFSQSVTLAFMQINFLDDSNLILQEQKSNLYYQQDENYRNYAFYQKRTENDANLPLIDYRIVASNKQRVITRRYQKLQDILGILGGLTSVFKLVGGFFVGIFVQLKLIKNTLNEIYYLPKKSKKSKRHSPKSQKKTSYMNTETKEKYEKNTKDFELEKFTKEPIISEINLTNIFVENKENKPFQKPQTELSIIPHPQSMEILVNKEEKKIPPDNPKESNEPIQDFSTPKKLKEKVENHENDEKIKFSTYSYLKNTFKHLLGKKLDNTGKIIVKASSVYEKEFDILLILKRLKDIEKIKMFLFNDRQLKLFELIDKLEFPLDNESNNNLNIERQVTLQNVVRDTLFGEKISDQKKRILSETLKDYQYNVDPQTLTEIDKKLLSYFEELIHIN